jgi:uncharacterized damage-inducible protein DinB
MGERAELLERYAAAPERLAGRLRTLPEAALTFRAAAGGWTMREVALHLADNEAVGFVRMRMAIADPGSVIQSYDEDGWVRELDYANEPLDAALESFALLRRRTHGLLRRLPEEAWARAIDHPREGPQTVDDRLRSSVEHDQAHLDQIETLRQAWESR